MSLFPIKKQGYYYAIFHTVKNHDACAKKWNQTQMSSQRKQKENFPPPSACHSSSPLLSLLFFTLFIVELWNYSHHVFFFSFLQFWTYSKYFLTSMISAKKRYFLIPFCLLCVPVVECAHTSYYIYYSQSLTNPGTLCVQGVKPYIVEKFCNHPFNYYCYRIVEALESIQQFFVYTWGFQRSFYTVHTI